MLQKLSLKNHEEWSLYGSFLVIISSFLPWYVTQYPNVELPWNGIEFSGNVYGYSLLIGRILIFIAAFNIIAVLYTRRKGETEETYLAKLFCVITLTFVFIFNVLAVVFLRPGSIYFYPNVGLLVLLVGVVATLIGLKKNYSDLDISSK